MSALRLFIFASMIAASAIFAVPIKALENALYTGVALAKLGNPTILETIKSPSLKSLSALI